MSGSADCCLLSGIGHCVGLIACTEESFGCLSVLTDVFCREKVCATD